MRRKGSLWNVYLVQVDGHEVPVDRQHVVYASTAVTRAQTICDALNNDLGARIGRAARAERVRLG
jgi:hypothetical protein